MDNITLKASVIISTYNRAGYLPNAVISIAAQSYSDVELVIVNGPSTDNTEAVLDSIEQLGIPLKRAQCANRNLSESRNIGIRQSTGDVLLFIDDDAVAHRDWISRLLVQHRDSSIGGAGGFTFDHTGIGYQCRYTICDKFGNARFFDTVDPETLVTKTSEFFFPSLLGTNCSFSRKVLEDIGGFDEIFEYMLDETDVCARIVESGKRIVTVPNAYVFHKYAPSATRTVERTPKSLLAPARSKAYFCFKHSPHKTAKTLDSGVFAEIERYRKDIDFSNKWFLDHKKISPAQYSRLSNELALGISEGVRIGFESDNKAPKRCPITDATAQTFKSLATSLNGATPYRHQKPLKIYFVSQGYPPNDTAGIARWTCESAQSLALKGHEIHVITRSSTAGDHVDFVHGVWVHSVVDVFDDDLSFTAPVPLPSSIARRATAVLKEIKRSESIWGVDLVSAPIWDVEGIMCCAHLGKPVITSLHTTYALALPFKPEWTTNVKYRWQHVDKVLAAESWLMENSVAILANSEQVISEINRCYDGILTRCVDRLTTIPHGIGSPVTSTPKLKSGRDSTQTKTKILFVGRLEERKGPDLLLSALMLIPTILDNVQVIFVGSAATDGGPYAVRLNELVNDLKRKAPQSTVEFVGYVSDEELDQHYQDADIFVAPSRFESFGLILIEAMRHGLPIIAGNIGGMREIVTSGVDGYLVDIDHVDELAARLGHLVKNEELRVQLGRGAKETYAARFTALRMAESMERLFCTMTERPSSERI